MSPPPLFCFGALTVCDASVAHASAIVTLLSLFAHPLRTCHLAKSRVACSYVVVPSDVVPSAAVASFAVASEAAWPVEMSVRLAGELEAVT